MDENTIDPGTTTQEDPPRTAEEIAEETNNAIREHIEHEIADPLRTELEKVKTENARLLSLLRGTSRTEESAPPDYIAEENKRRRENKSRQRATYPENS